MLQIISSNGPCVTRARSWAHDKSIPFFRFSPSLSSRVKPDESNNKVIVGFLWDAEVREICTFFTTRKLCALLRTLYRLVK